VNDSSLVAVLRRELEAIRAEYVLAGRGEDFDGYVECLRENGRWPFDNWSGRRAG
jgi:hypothetical protein